jgi:prepilin-type N-terminal cleavage/methylation domain-containing protein
MEDSEREDGGEGGLKIERCKLKIADTRRGFTFVELVVVMAILSLLIALAFPAIGRARLTARRVQCRNNLRNIGLAMVEAADVAGRFPAGASENSESRTSRGK